MRKTMNKIVSILLLTTLTITSTGVDTFAKTEAKLSISDQFVQANEVSEYLSEANEVIKVDEYDVNYYMGDDFVVVDDKDNGYSVITYNEDKTVAYVNGNPIKITITSKNFSGIADSKKVASSSSWALHSSPIFQVSVAGLGVTVGVGLLLGYCTPLKPFTSSIVSYCMGQYVSGYFPDSAALTCYEDDWVRVIDEYTTEWKYVDKVYTGTLRNSQAKYIGTWTTYQKRYN